jgi:dTDP-4-dehydrorhamnose reductase
MKTPIQRALVIGVAGQVGGALVERLSKDRVVGADLARPVGGDPTFVQFDLATAAATPRQTRDLVEVAECDVAFIAAGFTWVDGCQRDPQQAMAVNRDGPAAVARAAREAGARTVYYSTEYVFDGTCGPYGEDEPPHPISAYGKSKLEGEQAILAADPQALILRTTVVYGPEEQGKNFAYQLARHLSGGRRMRVPDDQVSSPTYNRDLAAASVELLESGQTGVFNVVGAEVMDRVEFARRVAVAAGLDAALIEPVATAALEQEAPRPLAAGLTIEKLRRVLPGLQLHSVKDAVADWKRYQRGKPWPE